MTSGGAPQGAPPSPDGQVALPPPESSPPAGAAGATYELSPPPVLSSPWVASPPIRKGLIVWEDPERGGLSNREALALARPVRAVERALYGPGGWRKHIDPASAADFALPNELFKNEDAFHASTYMSLQCCGLRRPRAALTAPRSARCARGSTGGWTGSTAASCGVADQTAHSPSPRMTWNGTLRFQSMNSFIVSSPNSTGIARSRTLSSKWALPTRVA